MSNMLQSIPDHIVGLILLGFGAFIFLDAWGIIQAEFLIKIGAIVSMWYGFMLLQGPQRLRTLFDKMQMSRKD